MGVSERLPVASEGVSTDSKGIPVGCKHLKCYFKRVISHNVFKKIHEVPRDMWLQKAFRGMQGNFSGVSSGFN